MPSFLHESREDIPWEHNLPTGEDLLLRDSSQVGMELDLRPLDTHLLDSNPKNLLKSIAQYIHLPIEH